MVSVTMQILHWPVMASLDYLAGICVTVFMSYDLANILQIYNSAGETLWEHYVSESETGIAHHKKYVLVTFLDAEILWSLY